MFGQFLNVLGIPQKEESGNDSNGENNNKGRAADAEEETERRRKQILSLGEFLSAAKVKRSTWRRVVESVRQVSEATIW
ncbi:hypothetical protein IW150_007591, partial [Coemansia sp. RSA 2607]